LSAPAAAGAFSFVSCTAAAALVSFIRQLGGQERAAEGGT
jgi:hypothetical protein